MNKQKIVKTLFFILNFIIIGLLIWSLIEYKFLNQEVSNLVQTSGLIAMIIFVIILEGAPVLLGPSVAVATILSMGIMNPWHLLGFFLASALIGNIFYYYLGYFSGKKILKYFDKKSTKKYEKLFKKYGRISLILMAVSPIPYLPTLAGVFKMPAKYFFLETLFFRAIRHTIMFLFWYFIL